MNLALTWCWKEWRAQRGMLLAYLGLVFGCLCLGLSLVPTHRWLDQGFGVHALSWFVAAGVIGVVAFVAPGLVRAEFGAKDDQFVRRLPGALAPSFAGKLLFFVLALLALPLLGLAVGELFLSLRGDDWNGLFAWNWQGDVWLEWPALVIGCGGALLLAPWVWAIGTWLPGGRMALGGTILFVLLLGVGVFAVLRQSPNLEQGLAWWHWLWAVPPVGLVVAAVSWVRGRRGGGPLRSARVGLLATALGLAPAGVWLGERVWSYRHPDLTRLADLNVHGFSPDGRFVFAEGSEQADWFGVPIRIDLQTGVAEQLGSFHYFHSPNALRPHRLAMAAQQRYWVFRGDGPCQLFDLVTGTGEPLAYVAGTSAPRPTPSQRQRLVAELRNITTLRLPGNRPVWCDDGALWTTNDDGTARRVVDVEDRVAVSPAGHAVRLLSQGSSRIVDPATGRTLLEDQHSAHLVRDTLLFVPKGSSTGQWVEQRQGEQRASEALQGCSILGLVDDDHVLCTRIHPSRKKTSPPRLFLYRPTNGAQLDIPLSAGLPFQSVQTIAPLNQWGSLLVRDPAGRIWLRCKGGKGEELAFLDVLSRKLAVRPPTSRASGWWHRLLAWPDANTVVVLEDARILRVDLTTGTRTQLFPSRD
ncbi:MAG: hypothetical protein WAT39_09110 [Planctomycetota bacterium]